MDAKARQPINSTFVVNRQATMSVTPNPCPPSTALNPQHICVVSETYIPELNGVALTLARLVEGLRARGHVVSLVRPRQRTHDRDDSSAMLTLVRGVPLPGYQGLQFGLPARGLLRRVWSQRRPDVLYVATEGPLGWSAVRIAAHLGIPVFSGFHTNFHSYSKYYRVGGLQRVIFRYLRNFHNCTRGTLAPSVDIRERLQTLGFKNVSLLDRGVDGQLFHPNRRCAELRRQWGVTEHDVVVLYVGRVAPEKNLQLAVDAYRAMKRVNETTKFVIVGDGPLRPALQREHPDLIFCGTCTGEQLSQHYASADVFLFPSETETFGNVTLEAMASGLVVIAYNYAAANMHLTQGQTGVLVPYGDARAFIDMAVNLAREPQSLGKMRRQARAHVVTFDWPRVIDRFASLLKSAHDF